MSRIREVWAQNLEREMRIIREVVEDFPYIAMDTEFPGVVARPIGTFKTSADYHYQTMRCNVDLLKIIQVGITLADENGELPEPCCTWQFNFRFSPSDDMYAPESIELLQKSGIDFERHEKYGIQPNDFAELMITSGLVLTPDTKWISFHSGYDFGYFRRQFFTLLRAWFPTVYDIKFMLRATKVLKGGLQDVADDLGVARTGPPHQAGSDSLLTASVFFKMRELYFSNQIDDSEYSGKLYGLGQTFNLANGYADPSRGGATIAEKDDRASLRERSQTPGLNGVQSSQAVSLGMGVLQTGTLPTPLSSTTFGPMTANGPYLRTSLVGGGR
ncbi:ribonuclease H-like domain-containing protein [Amanita rubescens]|nr:ribonuclease H-like domain-containing protein [Amanita rubescens]